MSSLQYQKSGQRPQIVVVDFHHARGPEVEFWVSQEGEELCSQNDWNLLPFMALSDGAHAATEDFSYFTLLRRSKQDTPPTSLFGLSCTRQINAKLLKNKSLDVTRSTVQKAVVVLTDEPQQFGQLRERLSAVTNAWFAQKDFTNIDILKDFQESLEKAPPSGPDDFDQSYGLSLREIVHELKYQTLVLFKCLLLQRKMLFYGSRCERLCMMQFSLVSLIPGLIRCLQDSADPALDTHAQNVKEATSLKTSDRVSLLAYMGLPLQIFGKGSFFSPYVPLQQLDLLASYDTKSYVVGSTNSLLLQQKDRYCDILVNLDENWSVTITSPSLRTALALSAADRRWIDFLTQNVNDSWDPDNPGRPKNMGYAGSEEFIRLQFEEYLLALLSSNAFQTNQESHPQPPPLTKPNDLNNNFSQPTSDLPQDPTADFNPDFIAAWSTTPNHALFSRLTAMSRIYDIIQPSHPTAGGLSIEDVQRRLAQQVADLHLDERMREGREMVNRGISSGRERMNKFWAERARSSSRTRESSKENIDSTNSSPASQAASSWAALRERAAKVQVQRPDTAQMQANAAKAGAYLSSWGSWAKERGKEWQEGRKSGGKGEFASPSGLRGGKNEDMVQEQEPGTPERG